MKAFRYFKYIYMEFNRIYLSGMIYDLHPGYWPLFISHEAVQVLISIRYTHRFIYASQTCHGRVTSGYVGARGQSI